MKLISMGERSWRIKCKFERIGCATIGIFMNLPKPVVLSEVKNLHLLELNIIVTSFFSTRNGLPKIGKNPIPFLIPCHRVIRKMGEFGNYGESPLRKKAILGWEAGKFNRRISVDITH